MKPQLAMRLLADRMQWDDSRAASEFAWLRLMVGYKYDHYQGYGPGSRFFVNLLYWLGQFSSVAQREEAYKLVRTRLIYISQREMNHLVALTMPVLEREMRRAVAHELGIPFHATWGRADARKRFKLMRLRTLFVALSDGARIDVFRRDNEGIVSNEQVVASSEISDTKWESVTKKLQERLVKSGYSEDDAIFERVCLIDDFTGSGFSLIRQEPDTLVWDGKVPRFCAHNTPRLGKQLRHECVIQVHHYLASSKAKQTISKTLTDYHKAAPGFSFCTSFSSVLSPNIVIDESSDAGLVGLLTSCYDESVQTTHTASGLQFGYRESGLSLVLDHNTPNNSVALLWAASKDNGNAAHTMRPLFPRKERHSDHGQPV